MQPDPLAGGHQRLGDREVVDARANAGFDSEVRIGANEGSLPGVLVGAADPRLPSQL
jgi:hypothetical protein